MCQSWGSDERDIPWSISLISRGVSGLGGLAGHSIPAQFTHPHTCTQLTSERRRKGNTNACALTHLEESARIHHYSDKMKFTYFAISKAKKKSLVESKYGKQLPFNRTY